LSRLASESDVLCVVLVSGQQGASAPIREYGNYGLVYSEQKVALSGLGRKWREKVDNKTR
jgi:hypothetical protein